MLVIYIHRLHRLIQNIIYRLVIPGTTGNPGFFYHQDTKILFVHYCHPEPGKFTLQVEGSMHHRHFPKSSRSASSLS